MFVHAYLIEVKLCTAFGDVRVVFHITMLLARLRYYIVQNCQEFGIQICRENTGAIYMYQYFKK